MSAIVRVPLDQAEGVVCTGLFDDLTETPETYRERLELALSRQLKLLCTNPDIVVDMGEARVFCAGAIAQLYEDMGGTAIYCGKPHPPIYSLARQRLAEVRGPRDAAILCIGDGIATDVQGGMAEGLDTCFVTGGLAATQFGPDAANPDKALLDAWLAEHRLAPTLAIPFLA